MKATRWQCAHHGRWFSLLDAIYHIRQFHGDCLSCQVEKLMHYTILVPQDLEARHILRLEVEGDQHHKSYPLAPRLK